MTLVACCNQNVFLFFLKICLNTKMTITKMYTDYFIDKDFANFHRITLVFSTSEKLLPKYINNIDNTAKHERK
jgi:hypothetical protein